MQEISTHGRRGRRFPPQFVPTRRGRRQRPRGLHRRFHGLGADDRFSPPVALILMKAPRFNTFYRPDRSRPDVTIAQVANVARKAAGLDKTFISKTVKAIANSLWNEHIQYTTKGYTSYGIEGPDFKRKYSTDPRASVGTGNQYPVIWVPDPRLPIEPEKLHGGIPVPPPDPTQGPPGPKGDPGRAGPPGEIGQRGAPGRAGPPGEIGQRGAPGPPGAGAGDAVPGPPGPRGEIGPMGPKGAPGIPGGAAAMGPRGEMGPMGPKGAPGVPGGAAAMGQRGEMGPMGPAGERGQRGEMGPMGPAGTGTAAADSGAGAGFIALPLIAFASTVI